MSDVDFESEKYDLERDNLAWRHAHPIEEAPLANIEENYDEKRAEWMKIVRTSEDQKEVDFYRYMISLKDMANEKAAGQKHRNN